MKELKFVLVGVNLNFTGMLLWLMASATGKGESGVTISCTIMLSLLITRKDELNIATFNMT